jgi:uncharacterized lipoprotein YddW (UPF0748 family)
MNLYYRLLSLLFFILLSFSPLKAQEKVSYPKNEFRGVWIATVANIDWPKSGTDSIGKQKTDFLEILDTYKKLNYNTVIVQIRTAGDAFYPTQLAPWSKYLTGKQGQAPKGNIDLLAWMISETHKRGFEFHAWLNPYRATMDLNTAALSKEHDYYQHPEWMIKYAGKWYYSPALPEVQTHLLAVVDEVVAKYDIDAIHFDDYFYPYKVTGENFNDTASYQQYGAGLSLEDFRRKNVNDFVEAVSHSIKKAKPWVQFGISPFGVWRNKSVDPRGSDTQSGQTNYDDLFADPMAWMENSWVDYLLPQLYWSMDHKTASYTKLLKWWAENSKNVAIYMGNGSYKINTDSDKKWFNPNEIPNQIDITRSYPNVNGNAFFSAKSFINRNKAVTDLLLQNQYKYPALAYVVPNSKKDLLVVPRVSQIKEVENYSSFSIPYPENCLIRYLVVYRGDNYEKLNTEDASQILDKVAFDEDKNTITITLPKNTLEKNFAYAISFIDYFGNESKPIILETMIKKAIFQSTLND